MPSRIQPQYHDIESIHLATSKSICRGDFIRLFSGGAGGSTNGGSGKVLLAPPRYQQELTLAFFCPLRNGLALGADHSDKFTHARACIDLTSILRPASSMTIAQLKMPQ